MKQSPTTAEPTQGQQLQAIATLCRREGIMPPPQNPTITGMVSALLSRDVAHQIEATRLRSELEDAKRSCYAYAIELQQALQAVAEVDSMARRPTAETSIHSDT